MDYDILLLNGLMNILVRLCPPRITGTYSVSKE